jgi:hypothetical protein
LVHENSLLYEETSAKTGFNVTESFEKIVNGNISLLQEKKKYFF